MKVYLSGPMTNIPEFNFPEFDDAQRWLEAEGYTVVSPAQHDREVVRTAWLEGRTAYEKPEHIPGYLDGNVGKYAAEAGLVYDLLVWDFQQIVQCDGIVMLPGWEGSSGGRAERVVAESTGKAVLMLHRVEFQSEGGTSCDWTISSDIEPKRLMTHLAEYGLRAAYEQEVGVTMHFETFAAHPGTGEIRVVDPNTGGAKGTKLARYDLVPQDALWAIAEHFGRGARKYEDRNWEKGYAWSLSYAALMRHIAQWHQGEDIDPDPSLLDDDGIARSLHLTAVAWHAMVLLAFALREDGTDDRPR